MFLRLRGSTFQNDPSQWKDGAWGEMMGGSISKASKPCGRMQVCGIKSIQARERDDESKASKLKVDDARGK